MKAIQITEEAYTDLVLGKQAAIEKASREGNTQLVEGIKSMGIGAFAGFLILTELSKLRANVSQQK